MNDTILEIVLPVTAVETSFPRSIRRLASDKLKFLCLLLDTLSSPDVTADGALTVQSIPLRKSALVPQNHYVE